MFLKKFHNGKSEALRSSKLRLENLEERQLLTAVGLIDVPYGPEPASVACVATVDETPAINLTEVAASSGAEQVLATTGGETRIVTLNTDNSTAKGEEPLEGTLRYWIINANEGDTIVFDDSLKGQTIKLRDGEFAISKSITIDASNLCSDGTPGITINANKYSRVMSVSGEDVTVSIIGLKLINGKTNGGGGGVYVSQNATLKAEDVVIDSCQTKSGAGGGVYVADGTFTATDVTISGNTATTAGGGVYVAAGGTFTATNVKINGENTATTAGGGVYVAAEGTFNATNVEISGNVATTEGGGVYVATDAEACAWTDVTISENIATSDGGGVYVGKNCDLTATCAKITGNTSSASGGGVYARGTFTAINTEISGNTATTSGGGVDVRGTFNAKNVTIAVNTCTATGGGIYVYSYYDETEAEWQNSGRCYLYNSIVSSNYASDGENVKTVNPKPKYAAYYCIVDEDAGFAAPPKWNGETGKYDYDLRLGEGSSAIDKGYYGFVAYEIDLGGKCRVLQGSEDSSKPVVDIGAYEYKNKDYGIIPTDSADSEDDSDGKISLREAIKYAAAGDTVALSRTLYTVEDKITIDKNITIVGNSATLSGGENTQILEVAAGADVTASDLTFQKGSAASGGALKNSGTLTLNNVTFSNNVATKNGGAVYNVAYATLTVNGGTFSGNSAKNGGAFCNYGTMNISGTEVATTISKNTATKLGGAYFGCGTLNIDGNANFTGNTAGSADSGVGEGGAIYNDSRTTDAVGKVFITGTVAFKNNTAVSKGGAIASYSKDATVVALSVAGTTSFVGNTAGSYGGAINIGTNCVATLGGTLKFGGTKTTHANTANFGGAIYSTGKLTFSSDGSYSFTYNSAAKSGGAVNAGAGTLTLGGEFTFDYNQANGDYDSDKSGFGGGIAIAADTTVTDGAEFNWGTYSNTATRFGYCVAIDATVAKGSKLNSGSFNLKDADYGSYATIASAAKVQSTTAAMVPQMFATDAVAATITYDGVATTFGEEGVTPEALGLCAGTHDVLLQYTDANGQTSVVYSLALTVEAGASIDVSETTLANGRGVKFNFNLANADGRAVSVWEISWGDGTTTRSENLSNSWLAAHYYAQDGTFDVSLKATYIDGTSETFEAFATRTVGTTAETSAIDAAFADVDDLLVELDSSLDCEPVLLL